jgi:hypothetical protein
MKVSELISLLQTFPPDHIVVMSKDSEGNSYSPYADFSLGVYTPDTTWYGDFTTHPEEVEDYKENAVCLWPVN